MVAEVGSPNQLEAGDAHIIAALAERYPVVRLLGRGGMGAVYLCRETALQRMVAVKVLLPELAGDPERREQFRREALTNARLAHPNIVPVYTVGEVAGVSFLVMRYVPGHSLAYRLWKGEEMEVGEVCRVLADLAGALHYAHQQRVVHRDIKPENVLLDRDTGSTMLSDFGVARYGSLDAIPLRELQAEQGIVRGTLGYMSPEQAAGEWATDGRSDLYSLGVLGYAMLCGRLPFEGRTMEMVAQHAASPPPPIPQLNPRVPPTVVEIIMRCLAKHPDDRWSDGTRLRAALIEAGVGTRGRVQALIAGVIGRVTGPRRRGRPA